MKKGTQIINTKGKQTIEADRIRGGGGIVVATRPGEEYIIGFVTNFKDDEWRLHNHAAHTISATYSTMKELYEAYPNLDFYQY